MTKRRGKELGREGRRTADGLMRNTTIEVRKALGRGELALRINYYTN